MKEERKNGLISVRCDRKDCEFGGPSQMAQRDSVGSGH